MISTFAVLLLQRERHAAIAAISLQGTVAANSQLGGVFDLAPLMAGTSAALAAVSADLDRGPGLAGTVAGQSLVAGLLNVNWSLVGSATGVSVVGAALDSGPSFAGSAAAAATLQGTLILFVGVDRPAHVDQVPWYEAQIAGLIDWEIE